MNKPMDKRFTPAVIAAAKAGQRAYSVPPSVSLAQWAVESAYGTAMPTGSNNPFGIKALAGQPSVHAMTREVVGGVSERVSQPFRAFSSLAEAFEAHAKLLATVSLYAPAMRAWKAGNLASGVKLMAQHYATDPHYATTIIGVIEANGLDAIDREVSAEPQPAAIEAKPPVAPDKPPVVVKAAPTITHTAAVAGGASTAIAVATSHPALGFGGALLSLAIAVATTWLKRRAA